MKKVHALILFAAIFVFGFTKTSFSQGNLQFNQVILFDIVFSGTQTINVPAGKVWKIESEGSGSSSSVGVYLRNSGGAYIAYFSSQSVSTTTYPYWLPSGFSGAFVNLHPSTRCTISIIEFNVVPQILFFKNNSGQELYFSFCPFLFFTEPFFAGNHTATTSENRQPDELCQSPDQRRKNS